MKRNPYRFFFVAAAILLAAVGLALWQFTALHPGWIYLIAVSVISFLLFGYDKFPARSNGPQIPDLVLHFLAAVGGSPGTPAGQMAFHHKTKKW